MDAKLTKLILSMVFFFALASGHQGNPLPYNGGNQFGFMYNNPYFLNEAINAVTASGTSGEACKEIPGVGLPILALKKFLIAVDMYLDDSNVNTFVKIIYFKETKTVTGLNVKLVVAFKTFTDQFYAGIEGEMRLKGNQKFRLLSYHFDTDISCIGEILGESNIDVNNFIGCGNLKEIYTKFLKWNSKPQFQRENIPYGQTALPLVARGFGNDEYYDNRARHLEEKDDDSTPN